MTTEQNAGNVIDERELTVTKAARAKIIELIQNAEAEINSVRVFVSGGGCNGGGSGGGDGGLFKNIKIDIVLTRMTNWNSVHHM